MNLITLHRLTSVGAMALLLAFPAAGQPWIPEANTIPDHVCLPSVSEEDAAWKRLEQELIAAFREFDAVDAPAMGVFRAEEKKIIMDLIKRKKELDARYEAASKLTRSLNATTYPCNKPELHSPTLVSACKELAAAADVVRTANNGYCREVSPDNHGARVNDGSPCAPAAKRYWSATSRARSSYLQRKETAEARYRREMMPACSLLQRIMFKELDRPTLRARQGCVAVNLSPAAVPKCTHDYINGR